MVPRLASSGGCFVHFRGWNSRFGCYPEAGDDLRPPLLCLFSSHARCSGLSDPHLHSEGEDPVDEGQGAEEGDGSEVGLEGGRNRHRLCMQLLDDGESRL